MYANDKHYINVYTMHIIYYVYTKTIYIHFFGNIFTIQKNKHIKYIVHITIYYYLIICYIMWIVYLYRSLLKQIG